MVVIIKNLEKNILDEAGEDGGFWILEDKEISGFETVKALAS